MTKLNRPSSETELKAVLDSAYDLACKSRYDEALAVCDWLIQDKTTEVAGYRERARGAGDRRRELTRALLSQSAIANFHRPCRAGSTPISSLLTLPLSRSQDESHL